MVLVGLSRQQGHWKGDCFVRRVNLFPSVNNFGSIAAPLICLKPMDVPEDFQTKHSSVSDTMAG